MFEAPLDAWYVWVGLAVVSSAAFGVVSVFPTTPPPDAAGAAEIVDGVAASEYAAVGKHPLSNAETVRVGTDSISIRGANGETEHESFSYAPATPIVEDPKLRSVLLGEPPQRAFNTSAEFERFVKQAQRDDPQWQRTDQLVVRRVQWGETDVVLVG